MENTLDRLRLTAGKFVVLLLWGHLPILLALGLYSGDVILPVTLGAAFAAVATWAWSREPLGAAGRLLAAVAYVGMVSLLLLQATGLPWQIDLHMYYFAALAILAVYCDWRVILMAAAATAGHHLVLNFAYPLAVFPDGGNFLRVVLHAVAVVLETAALVWLTLSIERSSAAQDANLSAVKEAATEADRLRGEQAAARAAADAARAKELAAVAGSFDASVGTIVAALADSSKDMQGTASAMASNAATTSDRAAAVSDAARQASANVATVAAASQELSTSAGEIARQVAGTAQAAERAAQASQAAGDLIAKLDGSAQRIGEVVSLITSIASQTNLLALNATIEAARAGDAGKGFAVVASEVKALATQTGKATDDIATQVEAIQNETARVVEAIGEIAEVAGAIRSQVGSIASAMDAQGTATSEIARNVEQAASVTQTVTTNIASVEQTAAETGNAAAHVRDSAQAIADQSQALARQVRAFMDGLKTGTG